MRLKRSFLGVLKWWEKAEVTNANGVLNRSSTLGAAPEKTDSRDTSESTSTSGAGNPLQIRDWAHVPV